MVPLILKKNIETSFVPLTFNRTSEGKVDAECENDKSL